MNREIKFRAWDGEKMIILPLAGLQYFDFEGSYALSFAVDGYDGFWSHECYESASKKAAAYPIMQFTGLKDYKGKEIYEGDLLRRSAASEWDKENFTAFEVFFHDGDAAGDHIGWVMNRTHYHGSLCGGYVPRFLPKNVSEMEIIGNIYANPELLKQ